MKTINRIITIFLAAVIALSPLSVYACRDFGDITNSGVKCTEMGEIKLGQTKVELNKTETKIYDFKADKSGFYSFEFTECFCGLANYIDSEYSNYEVLDFIDCSDDKNGCEIYNLKKGQTYKLLASSVYCEEKTSKSDMFTITYLGSIKDIEPCSTYVPLNAEGDSAYSYYDSETKTTCRYLTTKYNITFEERKFTNCVNDAAFCSGKTSSIESTDKPHVGENKVTVKVQNFIKSITINYFDISDYVEIDLFSEGFVPYVINGKRSDDSGKVFAWVKETNGNYKKTPLNEAKFTDPDGNTYNLCAGIENDGNTKYAVNLGYCATYITLPIISSSQSLESNTESLRFYLGKAIELIISENNAKGGFKMIYNAISAFAKSCVGMGVADIDYLAELLNS